MWTRLRPPSSLMAALPAETVDAEPKASPLWAEYAEEIHPESAREKLTAKLAAAAEPDPVPAPPRAPTSKGDGRPARTKGRPKAKADDGNAVTDFLKSREGRATVNNVVRGAFGVLKGFMK